MTIFQATNAPTGITEPQSAVFGQVEGTNGSQFTRWTRCYLGHLVAGEAQQDPFGSACPNISGVIFEHSPNDPAIARHLEAANFTITNALDGIGGFFSHPNVARPRDHESVNCLPVYLARFVPLRKMVIAPKPQTMMPSAGPYNSVRTTGHARRVADPAIA